MFQICKGRQRRRPYKPSVAALVMAVGADAHIGPRSIERLSHIVRGDVGRPPYMIVQMFQT